MKPLSDWAVRDGVDFLSLATDGLLTELEVATNGAIPGNPVGENEWTSHNIVYPKDENRIVLIQIMTLC